MKKQKKSFKKLFGNLAVALSLAVIITGSLKVNATELNGESNETVEVTIDNTNSHVGVRFYADSTKIDELDEIRDFEWIEPGESKTIIATKDVTARIRLYVQADGFYVPDGYEIEGTTKLSNDSKVNFGWCRAAFEIVADGAKTITIPEASVCTHPYADPSVRWGYYDCGDGTHAQSCTLCASDIPGTIANHTLSEMTATEYADWYYADGNFAGVSEENIASRKAQLIAIITEDLGVDANTKIKVCTLCEHWEKIETPETPSETPTTPETPSETPATPEIPSETPTTPETPSETPTTPETPSETPTTPTTSVISTSLKDNSGVLPEGTTIASVSVTSGDVYEKATTVVKQKISGLGQFAVMEINLTDASNTQIHQLNGYVQVSIPVPSNINVNSGKTITVYRLEDDGSLTRCQTTVESGVITFTTNHFSTYVIVEEDAIHSPKTGDDSYMIYIVCMMVFIIGLGFVVTAKKKIY